MVGARWVRGDAGRSGKLRRTNQTAPDRWHHTPGWADRSKGSTMVLVGWA